MIDRILRAFTASVFACTIIVLSSAIRASAQEAAYIDVSKVPAAAEELAGFVPDGWKIEEQIDGDLNDDGVSDHVLKLIEDIPADKVAERGRALIMVFEDKDGNLRNAAIADRLLQCAMCGGAFYGVSEAPANVKIEKGVIIVEQDHGSRWVTDTTYRFRFDEQPNKFILIGFDYSSRDRAAGGGSTESTNYLTGKRITTTTKGKRTTTKTKPVTKMRYSIEEIDYVKFEEEATKRLGLD